MAKNVNIKNGNKCLLQYVHENYYVEVETWDYHVEKINSYQDSFTLIQMYCMSLM